MSEGTIRPARRDDHAGIDALLRAAFPGPEEAALVRTLRAGDAIAAEQVTEAEGRIVAHAALSRMAAPEGWLCLAPVAVAPGWQGRGLGLALVRAVVSGAVSAGRTVVVLGAPAFYARAGFSGERAERLVSPYPISHTLIARPGDDVPEAVLDYPRAFAAL